MKLWNMIRYRLRRYFLGSQPVIPLIFVCCFIGTMYSVKPMNVCSGFVLSCVALFILMIFVSLTANGSEEMVEEQLLALHVGSTGGYLLARDLSRFIICLVYWMLLVAGPLVQNALNGFTLFNRPMGAVDILEGSAVILGGGLMGTALGDIFHPGIFRQRKLALVMSATVILLSVVKNGLIRQFPCMKLLELVLPPVMKPAADLGSGDYFRARDVGEFFLWAIFYMLVLALGKNICLYRKKFECTLG